MSIPNKNEMDIQNICLQNVGFSILLLLEHAKSNLHNHHPLCIVLLTTSITVPTTPN